MSDRAHPSGHPDAEPSAGRGLPAIPPPERETAAERQAARPVASWLGWSPTAWRSGS